jgi:hypothetical protein
VKPGAGKPKGNWNEWETARALSKWLTNGQDSSQLVRSVQSGGSTILRSVSNSRPEYQVGDLAPNGEKGEEFRRKFGVECKHTALEPDWTHHYTCKVWEVETWWKKINEECEPHRLQPLLIMKKNRSPWVVMMRQSLFGTAGTPTLTLHRLSPPASVTTFKEFVSIPPEVWYKAVQIISERLP